MKSEAQKEVGIVVNGEIRRFSSSLSVTDLLRELGWKPTQVVVERNGEVLPREKVGGVRLEEGDRLEIILPVAGG